MPKHKAFVDEYSHSTRKVIKKWARDTGISIVIPGDENQEDTPTLSDVESLTHDNPSPSIDSSNELNIDDLIKDDMNDLRIDEDDEIIHHNDVDVEFDDDDSDEENQENSHHLVYAGAPITLGESLVSILTFVLCNNLTGSAFCSLLALINLHCLQPNLLKSSVYLFRKHFSNMRYPIVKHFYCSACCAHLETSDSVCQTCNVASKASYFIEIPILRQLQVLFERRGFYESLQHRFNRKKKNASHFEDIYDGNVYRELSDDNGFLSNPDNISFTWNTDGVPLFKSSGYQIWPFYLSINELPFAERTKSDNFILAGLWFGPHKPVPNLFLAPFHSALREIYEGVNLNVPSKAEPVKVRGMAICGTCDLPAKALFLNMTQFNGQYGCPKCKLKGQREQRRWTYPFNWHFSSRTDEETRAFAEEALRINAPVYGVKGPSILSTFVHMVVRTTVVDPMHCIFSGVTKQLLTVMFDSAYSNHPASLREFIDLVDSRLRALTPPDFLQRRPRCIANHLKYWKANELKAWLFYYSLPILRDIMSPQYFEHYCMFVIGIFALYQSSISHEKLEYATRLLMDFVNRFDVLYGPEFMSCNLHQLLHLPETVRDFGPLWVASCFPYEDLNGKLKSLVHSSRHPELQICSAVSSILSLSTLRHRNLEYGSATYDFCSQLSNAKRKMKLQSVAEGIFIAGRCCKVIRLPAIVAAALADKNVVGRKFFSFSKLQKDGSLYTALSYTRTVKYNNTCVQYCHNSSSIIGIINTFIKIYNCVCHSESACECNSVSYAIIQPLNLTPILPGKLLRNVPEVVVESTGMAEQAVAIDVTQLESVCFLLKISDTGKTYVALLANAIEDE